jgi:hypothetical protein
MQAWHQFGLRAGEMAEDKRDESRGSGDQQASEEKDAAAPLVPAASSQAIAASGTQSPQSQDGQNIACLLLDDPPNPPGCWPYMVVKEGGENGSAEPVNVNEISRNLMSVKCSGKGDFFVIKALTGGDPLKHGRYARWVDRHEKDALVEYGVDLAYLREFKVRAPAGTFVAESVSRKGGDSLILLKAIRWRGRGDDCYLPILDIKWDVNETPELVARGGGTDWKIRWFDIDRRDKKNWQVTTIILGRANDYGWESPGDEKDLSFSYDAVLSLVQMGVPPHPEAPPELMDDKNRLEALISDRHWETGNPKSTAFCPELTAAFSYAFAKRMPEFSYYCRFLVFLLPDIIGENLIGEKSDYAPCKALAWIVEPATGGHVVMQGLKGILADRDEFRQILEQVKAFLERLREAEPDCRPRMIRLAAKCGYDGDKSPCSLDAAWMLLEEMAAKYQIAGSSPGGRPAGGWPVDTDAFKDSNRDVKNQGAGKSLRGRIFTISMFLTEASGNPWTDEARREIKEKSGKVKNWLQVQASRYKTEKNDSKLSFPDELWLGDDDASPLIVGEIPDHDTYANDWIENVVMRCIYGKPSADLLTELRKKYKFEGIHMVVYVNKQGRSYALPKAGTVTSPSDVLEGCIVYCRDKHGGLERSATIAHEVLHLYGAWDLYEDATALNAEQAQKAKECFPTDVMRCHSDDLSKEIVGPLTASLVGWSTKWYADWDFFKRKPKSG